MIKNKVLVVLFFLLSLVMVSKTAHAQTQLISNGGFESGPQFEAPPWILDGFDKTTGRDSSPIVIEDPLFARSGKRGLAIGTNNAIETASQQITIPSGATKVTLSFFLEISSVEIVNSVTDIMSIRLTQVDRITEIKDLEIFANTDENEFRSFKQVSYDITAFAGRTLVVQFFNGNDSSFNTIFNVDDVSVLSTGGSTGDFTISLTPTMQTVKPGETANYSIVRTGTFNGTVNITFSGLPPNSTIPAFNGPSPTPFRLVTSTNTPLGRYTFTATGTGGGITRTATATIIVGSLPNFVLTISPTSQMVEAGKSATFTINAQGMNGFNQPIELTAGVLGSDSSIQLSLPTTILPNNNATLTLNTTVNTIPREVELFLTGTVAQLQLAEILDFKVLVLPPSGPTITSVVFDGKKQLTIVGNKFGGTPKVFINNLDKTTLLKTVTDTVLIAKGKSSKLGLRAGNNIVQIIDSNGRASNALVFNNFAQKELLINIYDGEVAKENSSPSTLIEELEKKEKKDQVKHNIQKAVNDSKKSK